MLASTMQLGREDGRTDWMVYKKLMVQMPPQIPPRSMVSTNRMVNSTGLLPVSNITSRGSTATSSTLVAASLMPAVTEILSHTWPHK